MGMFWGKQNTKQRCVKDIVTKQKCATLPTLLPDSVFALYCELSLCGVQQRRVLGPITFRPPLFRTVNKLVPPLKNTVMLWRTVTGPLDRCGVNVTAEPSCRPPGVNPPPPPTPLRMSIEEDGWRLGVHRGAGPDQTDAHKVWHLAALTLHFHLQKLNRKVEESQSEVKVYRGQLDGAVLSQKQMPGLALVKIQVGHVGTPGGHTACGQRL